MRAIVKVVWKNTNKGWKAVLKTTDGTGFDHQGLEPGRELSMEIKNNRRCTGYAPGKGERTVCPEFSKIESGSQCPECRGKDIYSGYVRGDRNTDIEGKFSVYLAQIGREVKVGVTRSEKIPKRWIEQGADYGAELESGMTVSEALEKEENFSEEKDITERIRKEKKIQEKSEQLIQGEIEDMGYDSSVVDVQELTVYDNISLPSLSRSGVLRGGIRSVKGQIIMTDRIAMAMMEGKIIEPPSQKGLETF